jgi:hypothetical protein
MKTIQRVYVITACVVIIALASVPARAMDFTLNVPIEIKNLDEAFKQVQLRCVISGHKKSGASTSRVQFSVPINVDASGNINEQVIQVGVNAEHQDTDPRDIHGYSCGLMLVDVHNQQHLIMNPSQSETIRVDGYDRNIKLIDEAQTYNLSVHGSIPSP